ncbi:hypothetical protein [Burkholderia cepacia]|uniref:hypothetical protein n=1 Tax=Burkholderia cepacia TaxID=292 RepID=UPI002ED95EA9
MNIINVLFDRFRSDCRRGKSTRVRAARTAACAKAVRKGGETMAISGELHEADWSVAIETIVVDTGGYRCRVHVMIRSPNNKCERVFQHHRVFAAEPEAAPEGLCSGMTWIEMKMSETFTF